MYIVVVDSIRNILYNFYYPSRSLKIEYKWRLEISKTKKWFKRLRDQTLSNEPMYLKEQFL